MNSISQRVNFKLIINLKFSIHLGPVLYVGQGTQVLICYMWLRSYVSSTAKQTQG